MSAGAAAQYGLHLGSTIPVAFFTDAQVGQPNFSGYPSDKPHLIVPFRLVGIVEWRHPGRPGRRCRARQPDRGRSLLR